MINTLIEKKIGVKITNEILKFYTKEPVKDICLLNDKIFFIHDFFIGYVNLKDLDDKNIYWSGKMNKSKDNNIENACYLNPSSICSNQNKLLIVENGGKQLREIDINSDFVSSLIKGTDYHTINNLKNVKDNCATSIVTFKNNICWCSSNLNACFLYQNGQTKKYIGTGKPGNINFNEKENSLIDSPEGIAYYKDEIYISDTKNKCIKRTINNGLMFLLTNLNNPKKIKNAYNGLVFIDGNDIKMINSNINTNISLYNTKNNICITGNENKLYILDSEK